MVKHKTKLLSILLSVLLIIVNTVLIIAEAFALKEGLLYPRFNLDNPMPLISSCISFIITDALILLFVFKARGVGVRVFVAITVFFSAIVSYLFLSICFIKSWTSETTAAEDFLVMDERAEILVNAYVEPEFLNFDVPEIIAYKYYFEDSYEEIVDIEFTAKLTAERYATLKAMLANHEDATVIDSESLIEFYFDQRWFDKALGDGVRFEVEFSDDTFELHYKFWYQHDTV